MAYRLQYKRDTLANWQSANPILYEGEVSVVLNNSNRKFYGLKLGDGKTRWSSLPWRHPRISTALSTSGSRVTAASQKAVSDFINPLKEYVNTVKVK